MGKKDIRTCAYIGGKTGTAGVCYQPGEDPLGLERRCIGVPLSECHYKPKRKSRPRWLARAEARDEK